MSQEFQVVLLSGGTGSRMYPLTEGIPKALLPVANRPLISYQLEFLQRVGFTEVIVILSSEDGHAADIKKFVAEIFKGKLKVIFELSKGRLGTAEALLRIKDKLKTDFIVMSGDLILEEDFIHMMADIHRERDAAVTVLLKKPPPPAPDAEKTSKSGDSEASSDLIGINDEGRLLFFSATADVEENLKLPKYLLRKYPNITMYSNLLDAHFYIFSHWVLNVLKDSEKETSSIKGEFLPYLTTLQVTQRLKKGILSEDSNQTLATEMSSSASRDRDSFGCFAFILENGFCTRVNTIKAYMQANNDVARGITSYVPTEKVGKGNFVAETSAVNPKTQIGPECIVGEYTKIGEKCSVKKSCIGMHCNIGNNVKIINSVIMDHVTILDKCTVQNSIVCNNVHFAESCSVKDCQVGSSYSFDPKSEFKNESLVKEEE